MGTWARGQGERQIETVQRCKSEQSSCAKVQTCKKEGASGHAGQGTRGEADRDSAKVQIGAELLCKSAKVDSRNT